jgi:hypothetical protein
MNPRKIIRFLGFSVALVALLTFATVMVCGLHHHASANETNCPYCHLGHQAAVQPETGHEVTPLLPVVCSVSPEDASLSISFVVSLTPSRAPPTV